MISDNPSFEGYDRRDLAGGTPGRLGMRPEEVRRARRYAASVAAARAALANPDDPTAYFGPDCDRPAPPEALDAQVAYHAEGPGRPGDAGYLAEGGPGVRERYREARAEFYWKGGGRPALEAAAEHGAWEPLEMIRLLHAEGDLTGPEAADLARPCFAKTTDYRKLCSDVEVCYVAGCESKHFSGGVCRTHYRKERS